MGLAGDLARDKRAKGPLGEDASSLVWRLERRALYCWVSGMGSFAQLVQGKRGLEYDLGGFPFFLFRVRGFGTTWSRLI